MFEIRSIKENMKSILFTLLFLVNKLSFSVLFIAYLFNLEKVFLQNDFLKS